MSPSVGNRTGRPGHNQGFGPLVDVAWLDRRAGDSDVVVFDVRFDLAQPSAGRRQYLKGHVPGALYLDLETDLSGPVAAHGGRHPLPDPGVLASKLARAGVDERTYTVVYDDGSGQFAARAWWVLGYLGLDRVAVLDGGFPAWVGAGRTITGGTADEEAANLRPTGRFVPRLRDERIRDIGAIREWLEKRPPRTVLVDARAPQRYRGEFEPYDPIAGHIPGAINLPHTENLTEDGRWRSPAELADRFRDVRDAEEVIVYCGSGVSACSNILAMHLAGLENVRLYPGSWSDWCSYPDPPVARSETG